ncbi:MAG: hypothetical protein ACRDYX_06120 [Egibacteraceae bacterium]
MDAGDLVVCRMRDGAMKETRSQSTASSMFFRRYPADDFAECYRARFGDRLQIHVTDRLSAPPGGALR